jgi:hypothetical protein
MRYSIDYMTPADMPLLSDLCEEQNRRDGSNYTPQPIFLWDGQAWKPNPNVPLALKLVRDGRMAQGYTFERRLEFSSFGVDSRATAAALRELPQGLLLLEKQGYTGFHAAVPLSFVDQWERTLGKRLHLRRDDDRLAHYYRRFRAADPWETR